MATVTVTLDDELWLYRDRDDATWRIAPPWVRSHDRPAPGMVLAPRGAFRVLPAGTVLDVTIWRDGCAGCDAIREMQRHIGGVGETVTVEHTHGAP